MLAQEVARFKQILSATVKEIPRILTERLLCGVGRQY